MKMFTAKEKKNLSYLLSKVSDDEHDIDLEELHGILFGLAITPEEIPIEEWFPLVFTQEPTFENEEDAKACVGYLADAHDRIMHDSNEGKLLFPFNYKIMDDSGFSRISGWAYGLFLILTKRPDIWGMSDKYETMTDEAIPERLREVIRACVIITGVAFPEEMDGIYNETMSEDGTSPEDIEDMFYAMLPACVEIIQDYGRSLREETLPGGIHPTACQQPPKVGRNDPCPCGSGKKYKKCCGAN